MTENFPRTPFNDLKHIPTRAEIDLGLGVLGSITLTELEHRLAVFTEGIAWSMVWHNAAAGWSYRASYRKKILCLIHFYKKSFIVQTAIPTSLLEETKGVKALTIEMQQSFVEAIESPGASWVSFRVRKTSDLDGVCAVLKKKIDHLNRRSSD